MKTISVRILGMQSKFRPNENDVFLELTLQDDATINTLLDRIRKEQVPLPVKPAVYDQIGQRLQLTDIPGDDVTELRIIGDLMSEEEARQLGII